MSLGSERNGWIKEFEAMSDIELAAVATKPTGAFAPSDKSIAAQLALDARRSAKRDALERETLSIAREANDIARSQADAAWRAARYAMYAAIIAVVAAIIAVIKG